MKCEGLICFYIIDIINLAYDLELHFKGDIDNERSLSTGLNEWGPQPEAPLGQFNEKLCQ